MKQRQQNSFFFVFFLDVFITFLAYPHWHLSHHSLMPCFHQYKSTSLFDLFETEHHCCDVTAVSSVCVYVAINSSDTKRMSLRLVRKYTNIKCQKAWSQTPVCMCIHVHRRCCTAAHTDQRMPEILFYDVVLISSARSGLSCTVYLCDLYITNFWHTWGFI